MTLTIAEADFTPAQTAALVALGYRMEWGDFGPVAMIDLPGSVYCAIWFKDGGHWGEACIYGERVELESWEPTRTFTAPLNVPDAELARVAQYIAGA